MSKTVQDDYAAMSYKRARSAWENGAFDNEVDGVSIETQSGTVKMSKDEEFLNEPADIPSLRSLFWSDVKTGTVTAGNTSKLADGACAILLASEDGIKNNQLG